MHLSSSHPTSLSSLMYTFSLSLSLSLHRWSFISSSLYPSSSISSSLPSNISASQPHPICISLPPFISTMSNRRSSRQSAGGVSRISDDQIIELVSKLRQLLPEIRNSRSDKHQCLKKGRRVELLLVSASKVLQETCNYIRSLHKEVDDLSDRLSQLLATIDADSAEAAIIRSLLM
ncbi:hypothetical protein GQ457_02G011240 [Hibiscus cannabinus]